MCSFVHPAGEPKVVGFEAPKTGVCMCAEVHMRASYLERVSHSDDPGAAPPSTKRLYPNLFFVCCERWIQRIWALNAHASSCKISFAKEKPSQRKELEKSHL